MCVLYLNHLKCSLEIKKKGKLGSKSATGPSQSLTFEEQNFHGHLSRKKSVKVKNHSKIISRLANALCPKLGKLSKKVTIQNLIGWTLNLWFDPLIYCMCMGKPTVVRAARPKPKELVWSPNKTNKQKINIDSYVFEHS